MIDWGDKDHRTPTNSQSTNLRDVDLKRVVRTDTRLRTKLSNHPGDRVGQDGLVVKYGSFWVGVITLHYHCLH